MNDLPSELLECLEELSNIEIQKKLWLEGDATGLSSPDEVWSHAYDSLAFKAYVNEATGDLKILLTDIHEILENYKNDALDLDPQRMLNDGKWIEAVKRLGKLNSKVKLIVEK